MTERPPRAMTPLEAFDSRPRLEAALPTRAPLEPFEGLPRIPREPRLPTGFGELPHAIGTPRDTVADELQDVGLGDDDKTPADPETPYEMMIRRLNELSREVKNANTGSTRCYELMLEVHAMVGGIAAKLDAEREERIAADTLLDRRLTALEYADRWIPRFAWLVTTTIAIIALIRTYR